MKTPPTPKTIAIQTLQGYLLIWKKQSWLFTLMTFMRYMKFNNRGPGLMRISLIRMQSLIMSLTLLMMSTKPVMTMLLPNMRMEVTASEWRYSPLVLLPLLQGLERVSALAMLLTYHFSRSRAGATTIMVTITPTPVMSDSVQKVPHFLPLFPFSLV